MNTRQSRFSGGFAIEEIAAETYITLFPLKYNHRPGIVDRR
jgi:hypothetical protein